MRLAANSVHAWQIVLCVAVFVGRFSGKKELRSSGHAGPSRSPHRRASPGAGRDQHRQRRTRTPAAGRRGARCACPSFASFASLASLAATPFRHAGLLQQTPTRSAVSRVVEIDTTGGPGFGFEHFKAHDFLREGEGRPHLRRRPVAQEHAGGCSPRSPRTAPKAIFFPIGLHANLRGQASSSRWAAARACRRLAYLGGHQDLSKTKGHCQINGKTQTVEYDPKDEIEKGISAVSAGAVGGPNRRPISAFSGRCASRRS